MLTYNNTFYTHILTFLENYEVISLLGIKQLVTIITNHYTHIHFPKSIVIVIYNKVRINQQHHNHNIVITPMTNDSQNYSFQILELLTSFHHHLNVDSIIDFKSNFANKHQ